MGLGLMTIDGSKWDVVVIGAGPAGSMAALAAAESGARTLLIERSDLPRYKLCGGGLVGTSLRALPTGFEVPVLDSTTSATFSLGGQRAATRTATEPFIWMIDRSEFDSKLVAVAESAGTVIATGVTLEQIEEDSTNVSLRTSAGIVRTRSLVGADGSASRVAGYVGAKYAQVDLGLEVELAVTAAQASEWRGRLHLDFGELPGSYAWVFPKGHRLTVGAIARRGNAAWQQDYLKRYIESLGLSEATVEKSGGHLTRCRDNNSPLVKGRVLLCGDAAGLLEPWTREGISFALRSGRLAGSAAAGLALGHQSPEAVGVRYAEAIAATLGEEIRAGAALLSVFTRHPVLVHKALTATHAGWSGFERLSRGETTLDRAMRRRPVRLAVAMAGGRRTREVAPPGPE